MAVQPLHGTMEMIPPHLDLSYLKFSF